MVQRGEMQLQGHGEVQRLQEQQKSQQTVMLSPRALAVPPLALASRLDSAVLLSRSAKEERRIEPESSMNQAHSSVLELARTNSIV